jgi:hypothetical protein
MRKIIIALTTVIVIVFLIIFMTQVGIFRANFLLGGTYPTIDIHSPLPQPYIYSSNHIEISIDYSTQAIGQELILFPTVWIELKITL